MPPEPNLGQQNSFCIHHPWAKTSLQAWRIFCQVANATLRQTLQFIIGPNTGSYGLPRWEFLDNVHPKSHVIPWTQPLKKPGISPHMYTCPFFQSSHVVYVKMPFHPPDQKRRWSRSPDIFILVPLPFQPWNVNSTGLQNWNQFGATSQFTQKCQSATGAPGQILNAQCTTMPGSVNMC